MNVASLVIASIWLLRFRSNMPRSSGLLLRISAASALLSLAMIPVSRIAPEHLPTALLVLMPGRFLNFCSMTLVAMVIGLLASRRELWSRCSLLFLVCGLLASDRSMLWEFLEHHQSISYQSRVGPLWIVWIAATALIAGDAWTQWKHGAPQGSRPEGRHYRPPSPTHRTRLAHPLVYALLITVLGVVVLMTLRQSQPRTGAHFADRTNDVFFADVASRPGMLLVAGDLYLIQLRTRRPVLLDAGAIDAVMYSLDTGPAMQKILRDVYGLDLFNPPRVAIGTGSIPALAHRATWEAYSEDRWREIGRTFNVTQVLTYADWSLDLPIAAHSGQLLLYDIPGP